METKLKAMGLTDEQVAQAKAIMQEEINGKFIPKTRFDEVNTQAKETKKQLEELSKVKPEELNQKINDLTKQLEDKEKEFVQKERNLIIDSAIEKTGARNTKALKGLLDFEKVDVKDGKIVGLDEQITALKESDAYLFGDSNNFGGKTVFVEPKPELSSVEEAFYRLNPSLNTQK